MNKKILIITTLIVIIGLFFILAYFSQERKEEIVYPVEKTEEEVTDPENKAIEDEDKEVEVIENEDREVIDDFVQCLADAGMVIYGTKTCPACLQLAQSFGGYEMISPIYIECSEEWERCSQEMQTNYVPEIQIKGKVYTGPTDLGSLGEAVGCEF